MANFPVLHQTETENDKRLSALQKQKKILEEQVISLAAIHSSKLDRTTYLRLSPSMSLLSHFFFGLLWTALFIEVLYFVFQWQTSGEGAKDTQTALFGDSVRDKYSVRASTSTAVICLAIVNFITDWWGASANLDARSLLYTFEKGLGQLTTPEKIVLVPYMCCALISFTVGGLANGAGVARWISSRIDDDSIFYATVSPLFLICWFTGVIYYLANSRRALDATIEEVLRRFASEQTYPESSSVRFIVGYYSRLLLALWGGFRAAFVRAASFAALFSILAHILRISLTPEEEIAGIAITFFTTFVVCLPRLVKVFKELNPFDALSLQDHEKEHALGQLKRRDILLNTYTVSELMTAISLFFFVSFFYGMKVAAPSAGIYFLFCLAAITDLETCRIALKNRQPQSIPDDQTVTSSASASISVLLDQRSSTSPFFLSSGGENVPTVESSITDDGEITQKLETCIEKCQEVYKADELFVLQMLTAGRIFSRGLQLVGFFEDLLRVSGLNFPLLPIVFLFASAVFLYEYKFALDNIVGYRTAYLIAWQGVCLRLGIEKLRCISVKEICSMFKVWSILTYTGVHSFTVDEWKGIVQTKLQQVESNIEKIESIIEPEDTDPSRQVICPPGALFPCLRKQNDPNDLGAPLFNRYSN